MNTYMYGGFIIMLLLLPQFLHAQSRQCHCAQPRRVYLDFGVNWGNTLRLFEDDATAPSSGAASPWQIFGFEASPLIQPFADEFVSFLNGRRASAPVSCLPPAGSPQHLHRFLRAYDCGHHRDEAQGRQCLYDRLAPHLDALAPDPRLNSSELLATRLAEAQRCPQAAAANAPRHAGSATAAANRRRAAATYTLIPAAASGPNVPHVDFWSPPAQLIAGGGADNSLIVHHRDHAKVQTEVRAAR